MGLGVLDPPNELKRSMTHSKSRINMQEVLLIESRFRPDYPLVSRNTIQSPNRGQELGEGEKEPGLAGHHEFRIATLACL